MISFCRKHVLEIVICERRTIYKLIWTRVLHWLKVGNYHEQCNKDVYYQAFCFNTFCFLLLPYTFFYYFAASYSFLNKFKGCQNIRFTRLTTSSTEYPFVPQFSATNFLQQYKFLGTEIKITSFRNSKPVSSWVWLGFSSSPQLVLYVVQGQVPRDK